MKIWEIHNRPEFIDLIEYNYYVYTTRHGGEWFAVIDEENSKLWVGGVPSNWDWFSIDYLSARSDSTIKVISLMEIDEIQWITLIIRTFYSIIQYKQELKNIVYDDNIDKSFNR